MGQKVHPYSLRIKINRDWKSKWYFDKKLYSEILHEDFLIRRETMKFLKGIKFDISDIEIIRNNLQRVTVVISTPRPGSVIGVKGANLEKIGQLLTRKVSKKINIKIKEIKKPEFDAQIVANGIAKQLENRASYRKLLKSSLLSSISKGIQGIKIKVSGRLGGAEIARSFEVKEGRIPLHTLRANIDYGFAEAYTTYGVIGVKVWLFKGEILGKQINSDAGQVINRKPSKDKVERFDKGKIDDKGRKVVNDDKFSREKLEIGSRSKNDFKNKNDSDI
ncbi:MULTISPECIES: 30S ribosomal protein S3 [Borrelia]|uniref:Small ribosomal subunit protein uS3 n=2 Tax=Borrelia TaxID=138 RepID=RS3_BORDL|nr:30S ribosomal protein S3 [Borrelia recurrentis]B5RM42.1 RecName: Full=Small ribosomal subunit protein uS3; AltName: Full=30S ribosomal protein S3 [Borrelia duttonii Ly]B5RPI8.1 RecName: Full=Small ribosomal subunit protein uS3; AltName: Full=30S ribosomal protein S3 [Borrelia recurrentis A1]ACH93428.1 30S ribosomal protein S3 [Borrelia duttonii Ly]ACH94722.1 30S ribosomal protein S3 [Borrelia recurrentis A1]